MHVYVCAHMCMHVILHENPCTINDQENLPSRDIPHTLSHFLNCMCVESVRTSFRLYVIYMCVCVLVHISKCISITCVCIQCNEQGTVKGIEGDTFSIIWTTLWVFMSKMLTSLRLHEICSSCLLGRRAFWKTCMLQLRWYCCLSACSRAKEQCKPLWLPDQMCRNGISCK